MDDTSPKKSSNGALMLVLIGGLLLPLVGFFVVRSMLRAYSWRDTTERGILVNSTDWPEPIQEIETALARTDAQSHRLEVYLLDGKPASTLSTVICRVRYSEDAWATVRSRLDLHPVESSFVGNLRTQILSKSDESWWPATDHDAKYFASARLLAGDEADLYVCSVDPVADMIYIHYYFNF